MVLLNPFPFLGVRNDFKKKMDGGTKMKYKLSVLERITLRNLLSSYQGTVLTAKIVRDIMFKLEFDEKELKHIDLEELPDGNVKWEPSRDDGKEVDIGEKAMEIIQNQFKKLDEQGKINLQILDVFERFLPKEKEEEIE